MSTPSDSPARRGDDESLPGMLAGPLGEPAEHVVPAGASDDWLKEHAERLLVELFSLEPAHRGGTDAELRAVLEAASPALRQTLGELQRDLGMLDGVDEPSGGPRLVGPPLRAALFGGDAPRVLWAMRATPGDFPAGLRAELRGRAWGRLGFMQAAVLFLSHAHELGQHVLPTLLDAMRVAGQYRGAARLAEAVPEDAPPLDALAAVRALVWAEHSSGAPALRRDQAEALLARVDATLDKAERAGLGPESHPALVRSFTNTLALRAHLLDQLGRLDEALKTVERGVRLDPADLHLRVVRAALRTLHGQAGARPDWQAIVDAGLPVIDAYVRLAHELLDAGEAAAAERVCQQALVWPLEPASSALVHELLGISLVRQGRPRDGLAALELAAGIAPTNTRLVANVTSLRRQLDQPKSSGRGSAVALEVPARGQLPPPKLELGLRGAESRAA